MVGQFRGMVCGDRPTNVVIAEKKLGHKLLDKPTTTFLLYLDIKFGDGVIIRIRKRFQSIQHKTVGLFFGMQGSHNIL